MTIPFVKIWMLIFNGYFITGDVVTYKLQNIDKDLKLFFAERKTSDVERGA